MLNEAISKLIPDTNWRMQNPPPTNEAEFLERFEIQTGVSEERDILFSNDPSDFGITWSQVQAKVTELENAVPLSLLREFRNMKLQETDWWANSDLTMTSEQTAYRQALRDITDTYTSLDDVVWPTKPE